MSERADTPQGTHKATGWPEATVLAASAMKQGVRASKPPSTDGRDSRGRFAAGNHEGVGGPLTGRVQKLRAQLMQAITPSDIADVAHSLIDRAVGGDIGAAKLLLAYAIGKPVETIAVHDESERFNTRVIFEHVDSVTRKRDGVEIIGGPPMND